uniref:Uncharacterized protein n=1 Tax=Anguilla anguilla TaxID=7936 RepID=A0A0E9V6S4_ANGAN
MCKSEWTNH